MPALLARAACRHGDMLYFVHDVFIGIALEAYGEWCEGELDLLLPRLRPGDVVVDAGANVGTHTLAFARAVGPTGAVWAFEPQRLVHQVLCANLALNEQFHVHARQEALGAQPGTAHIPVLDPAAYGNYGGVATTAEGESVPLRRIDDLALPACRLIKIDVEGHELAVLAGARETIARHRPLLYVENERPEHTAELTAAIAALGYTLYAHEVAFFNPANHRGETRDIFTQPDATGTRVALTAKNLFAVPS